MDSFLIQLVPLAILVGIPLLVWSIISLRKNRSR